ncbi:MAG: M55 family metallopeptidase [Cereibacter changlensis]|jgi:D-amino peptidase|uniref:Peptide ABC transporter n=1 Tax=Cereibacter changlensis TaxID=402884 RepID=A0A4U0YU69_9RHOB|nr:M55 family metallopeptidase [Cereibacter changlensis]TKA94259.1 peptide ABC transporter [Cereibacter changlensis]
MKIFISADIEGTAGITEGGEGNRDRPEYAEFREYMTDELVAACQGARAAGATEILVKDAHASARNLILSKLPDYVSIVRGWSGHPDLMMFGLDDSFDAALYTGYHDRAGADSNPLAHTLTGRIQRILLNGEEASEFTLNALCAARYGVPSSFLSGDRGMCEAAAALVPGIVIVATSEGYGSASRSMSPARSVSAIRDGVEAALSNGISGGMPAKAGDWELRIEFSNPVDAYRGCWYPGVEHVADRTLQFRAIDFFEIQRAIRFIVM